METIASDVTSRDAIITVTATAPVNIAVIKYWGKRSEELILPINGSISATLDQQHLRAKTTVSACRHFEMDQLWLNGAEEDLTKCNRIQNVLKEIRRRARKRRSSGEEDKSFMNWKIHICSENNFPTAAGLASSAAGYACLVFCLAKLFRIDGDVSDIARQGSGSACRSMYGGFVEWTMGSRNDGSDSIARQIVPENYWPNLRILILVVTAKKKHTGSTVGMQTSVETSRLLAHRAAELVPNALADMTTAIRDKDFHKFAELTMKDSNQMHATCLDTYPPISYLTDISHDIIRLVHAYNDFSKRTKVAYTFDAGPNACLYLEEDSVETVCGLIKHFFCPLTNGEPFLRGLPCKEVTPSQDLLSAIPLHPSPTAIQYVIHTKVGSGPQTVESEAESLLNTAGLPIFLKSL